MKPLSFDLDEVVTPACGTTRRTLLRFHVGELPSPEAAKVAAHTFGCLDCQTQLAEFKSDDAAFRTHIPWNKFVVAHEKREAKAAKQSSPLITLQSWWQWVVGGGAMLGLAGAAAMFLVAPTPKMTSSDGAWDGLKGKEVAVGFLLKTADGVRPGRSGEELANGDRIQLMVRGPSDGMALLIVDVDGKGGVNVLHAGKAPPSGNSGVAPLPESLVLDDATGPERFFALYVPEAELEATKAAAGVAAKKLVDGHVDLRTAETLPLDVPVKQDSVFIVKVAR